jgi:hypothetical protein
MLDYYGRIALKRGLRRAAIMLTVALSPTVTLAQTELPSNADALFLDFFSAPNIGCFAYPLGKVQLLVGGNGGPAPTNDFNRDMLALEKMGLLRIEETNERQARSATFNVTLSAKPDGKDLVLRSDVYREGFCIKVYDYSPAKVEFKKVEYVQGGNTGWTGAIADAVIHDKVHSIVQKV